MKFSWWRFLRCELRGVHVAPLPPLDQGVGSHIAYLMHNAHYCATCGLSLTALKRFSSRLERIRAVWRAPRSKVNDSRD